MDATLLEQGSNLFLVEKYNEAMDILLPLAKQGNATAQSKVGFIYFLGLTGERNLQKALHWLMEAANQGNGEAAHNLGTLYLTCEPDFPRDIEKSRFWYLKARNLGVVVAHSEWYHSLGSSEAM